MRDLYDIDIEIIGYRLSGKQPTAMISIFREQSIAGEGGVVVGVPVRSEDHSGLVEGGRRGGLGGEYAGSRGRDGHTGIQHQGGAQRGGGRGADLGGQARQSGGSQQAGVGYGHHATPLLIAHCRIQNRSRRRANA